MKTKTMVFRPYPKIKQFKDVVREVKFSSDFKGLDEENQPIYEKSVRPTLTFTATVKLHGTNAGVCYTPEDGVVAQKRKSLIPKDALTAHFGFNQLVQVTKKTFFEGLMKDLYGLYCNEGEQVTVYGEFAGSNIQKGVGMIELPKAFYIFDIEVYNHETEESKWIDVKSLEIEGSGIKVITDFPTYSIEIDFNAAALSQEKLVELTNAVEKDCPVSRQLLGEGFDGELIGEGLVWTAFHKGQKYNFKVKGHLHSTSKVKKLASVDPEIVRSIFRFVDYACTPNRIEQGIKEVEATEKKHMPLLLKWMSNDIITEEDDSLQASGLEWKQVARECSNRVRQYYFAILDHAIDSL